MTLQSSGAISLGDIRTELGNSGSINIGGDEERALGEDTSGDIQLSDFYGKEKLPYIRRMYLTSTPRFETGISSCYQLYAGGGDSTSESNVSSITASSTEGTNYASYAFDTSSTTQWISDSTATGVSSWISGYWTGKADYLYYRAHFGLVEKYVELFVYYESASTLVKCGSTWYPSANDTIQSQTFSIPYGY